MIITICIIIIQMQLILQIMEVKSLNSLIISIGQIAEQLEMVGQKEQEPGR